MIKNQKKHKKESLQVTQLTMIPVTSGDNPESPEQQKRNGDKKMAKLKMKRRRTRTVSKATRQGRRSMGFLPGKGLALPAAAIVGTALFGDMLSQKIPQLKGKEAAAILGALYFAPVKGLKRSPLILGAALMAGSNMLKTSGLIPQVSGWEADLPMIEGYAEGSMARQIGLYAGQAMDRSVGDLGIQLY